MAFSAILRRSVRNSFPFVSHVVRSQRNYQSSIAVYTAVKRAEFSSRFLLPTITSFSTRHLCSNIASSDCSSDKKLLEVLQSEISVVEESEDHDKTVDTPSDFPFKIEDNVGEQTVTLTREHDGETITVVVSMPSLVTGEGEEDNDNEDNDNENDDNGNSRNELTVPLLVTVAKKNGLSLIFNCVAYPDEISIISLALKNHETEERIAYEGPEFMDVDENLQKAFNKYLEIRGIKPSTTNFLYQYLFDKDNKEYFRWLKVVKKFVEA
ncbi:uncharacterized protein At2g39795, mitochondrial-like [Amaranthus tricolor]|uniref:uncharacterized protein At2g39795, mitochondrial-like n=1 Tax=Amaranthus tricolor TaxID=29722 RepID=UPI002582EE7D|nr:uncharacterized protein At2g39795, mitochondrial-like [Amaranthus tricolor]